MDANDTETYLHCKPMRRNGNSEKAVFTVIPPLIFPGTLWISVPGSSHVTKYVLNNLKVKDKLINHAPM